MSEEQRDFSTNGHSRRHFGNYDLVRRIDVGGMGEVYLARQRTAFGREVAVKIMRSDMVDDAAARKRFLREAEVSAHLKHEHILPLVEFGEEQGRLFLVTPYIAGGTLAERLQQEPLSLSEVHELFSALVRAIAYIHKRGVIHRDLKPSNILLDQEEEGKEQVYVRLIDFGIATITGLSANARLTTAGKEMGTIAYMAPERLDGVAAPSNDIYSLGVILYQMLTGHLPTGTKVVTLPQSLESIVRCCTALQAQDRFATADELLDEFEYAYSVLSATSTPVTRSLLDDGDDPATPRRSTTLRPLNTIMEENITASLRSGNTFSKVDYNAPTSFDPTKFRQKRFTNENSVVINKPKPRKRSSRMLPILFTLAVLLAVAGLSFAEFQAAISARVTISPQVQSISKVLTVRATTALQSIDPGSASIPAHWLTSTRTGSRQGPNTGSGCFIYSPIIGCIPLGGGLESPDTSALTSELQQNLKAKVKQDLQNQEQSQGATPIGQPQYSAGNYSITSQDTTVTVTLTVQGVVESFKRSDLQTLVRLLLSQQTQQQLGQNYVLINTLLQVGQPAVDNVDSNGVATIRIAVGGVAKYQIPSSELQSIQDHIKGMSAQDAWTFITQQEGLDPNLVTIRVSFGDTLPSDVRQITIVPVNPINIPSVQLPILNS